MGKSIFRQKTVSLVACAVLTVGCFGKSETKSNKNVTASLSQNSESSDNNNSSSGGASSSGEEVKSVQPNSEILPSEEPPPEEIPEEPAEEEDPPAPSVDETGWIELDVEKVIQFSVLGDLYDKNGKKISDAALGKSKNNAKSLKFNVHREDAFSCSSGRFIGIKDIFAQYEYGGKYHDLDILQIVQPNLGINTKLDADQVEIDRFDRKIGNSVNIKISLRLVCKDKDPVQYVENELSQPMIKMVDTKNKKSATNNYYFQLNERVECPVDHKLESYKINYNNKDLAAAERYTVKYQYLKKQGSRNDKASSGQLDINVSKDDLGISLNFPSQSVLSLNASDDLNESINVDLGKVQLKCRYENPEIVEIPPSE